MIRADAAALRPSGIPPFRFVRAAGRDAALLAPTTDLGHPSSGITQLRLVAEAR